MKRQCGSDAFLVITSVEGTYLSDLDAGSDVLPSRNRKCGKTLFGVAEVLAVAYPKLKDTVPAQFADVESKPFYRAINTVDLRQFIRIKADEATYNLILCCASNWNSNYYRKLKVADLPAAWSARLGPVLWHRPTAQ